MRLRRLPEMVTGADGAAIVADVVGAVEEASVAADAAVVAEAALEMGVVAGLDAEKRCSGDATRCATS